MLHIPLLVALALTPQGGAFLAHNDAAYVAGPTYTVAQASADARFRWNRDGTRLAYVTQARTETPRSLAAALSRGESVSGNNRLGIWSADTGRSRDIVASADPTEGVSQFEFLGKDLVYSTFSSSAPARVWIAREGALPREIVLPEDAIPGIRFAAAKKRYALLMASNGLWLVDANRTRRLETPGYTQFLIRWVSEQDKAVIMAIRDSGESEWLLVDLETGALTIAAREPEPEQIGLARPFVLDAYKLEGTRVELDTHQGSLAGVDAMAAMLAEEDAGYRLDLVESVGEKRRRIPFIYEMAKFVEVSSDGLHFAFVSNRMIMTRSMIKLDKASSERLLGKGSYKRVAGDAVPIPALYQPNKA